MKAAPIVVYLLTSVLGHRATVFSSCIPGCSNGGPCVQLNNQSSCTCATGYIGDRCQFLDPCWNGPCMNGGRCVPDSITGHFHCACLDGFFGLLCSEIAPCAGQCLNGGRCVWFGDRYGCRCGLGFYGTNCTEVDYCWSSPCQNGQCMLTNSSSFLCACDDGYAGPFCELTEVGCSHKICGSKQSSCFPNKIEGKHFCYCQIGLQGRFCDEDANECVLQPCSHNSTCINTFGSFYCDCVPGWKGQFCSVDIDECLSSPCFNGGYCVNTPGSFKCSCPLGYTGSLCDVDIDVCQSNPCGANGFCESRHGSLHCICSQGYTGRLCGDDVDECLNVTMCGSGRCLNSVGSFSCDCSRTGMFGNRCQIDVDECASLLASCQHNGTCINTVGSFVCLCNGTGFSGPTCADDVDECALPGACALTDVCLNTIGSYICTCSNEDNSTQGCDNNPCRKHPCRHGGTCQPTAYGPICNCTGTGYTGQRCETDIDECILAICNTQAEACINLNGSFLCKCSYGYIGPRCEIQLTCPTVPCLYGGVCNDAGGQRFCRCPEERSGSFCEIDREHSALSSAALVGITTAGAVLLLAVTAAALWRFCLSRRIHSGEYICSKPPPKPAFVDFSNC